MLSLNKLDLSIAFCAYCMALLLKLSQKELIKDGTTKKKYIGYVRENTIWLHSKVFAQWTLTLIWNYE